MISKLARKYLTTDKSDERKDVKKYASQAKHSSGPLKKLFSGLSKDERKHHRKLKNANR